MKKFLLLLFTIFLTLPTLRSQQPDAIYIATWVTMSELGSAVTPNDNDPKLSYNASTGCYEGAVIDWPKIQVNPYNAKIPYSVEGGEITYYGVEGTTQQLIFNTEDSQTFKFEASTDPSKFKGFGISGANDKSVEDVRISIDLTTSEITFTQFESGQGAEIPTLVSIDPANGSEIVLDEDGGTTIVLTFSGTVDSMEVLSEDGMVRPQSNDDGTVWTLPVTADVVEGSVVENQGKLIIKLQKVFANGLPVSFDQGNTTLYLVYTVAGMTSSATFYFTGDAEGLETLNVYKAPYYSVGDQLDFEGDTFSVTYTQSLTYLYTVSDDYVVSISSTVASNDGENWALGEGYSTEKGENGETTDTPAEPGVTLTLYPGADGATFTIKVTKYDAGIESLINERGENRIYTISGTRVRGTDVNSLNPGLYIVNGKKVLVK